MNDGEIKEKKKKGFSIAPFLLLIIGLLGYYVYTTTTAHKEQIISLENNCSPVNSSESIELDLNSTIVQDLYKRVKTNIREDVAQPQFNDNMKLYLAYRQILETDKYDSNCNLFTAVTMEPFVCEETTNDKPKAFKEELLKVELKKLFGENSNIPLANIKLGNSCLGGYAYIPERGEFVEGKCSAHSSTEFSVDKNLTKATSTRNTVVLTEEVKYHENEKMYLPDSLKSGYYHYTFKLDVNYNYVLISKTYESKH